MKIGKERQRTANSEQRAARRFWKFAVICSLFALRSALLFADDFQISDSLDRNQIALNEQAVLSLTVSGSSNNLPQPQLPGLPDFQIYNAGRSQNFTWINGKASASVTYNFVLTPLKEGRFTIPALRMQFGGTTAQTTPLVLDVVKGDAAAISAGGAREEGASRPVAAHGASPVFITGTVNKTSVYVGEPIIYNFRLYNRVPLLSRPNYQPPEMTGFWAEDLPPQRNFTESVKGVPYNVTEVRTALFPSTPGKAKVGSASLTVNLENFGSDPMGSDFFAQFFGRGEDKTLRTEPISITVRPLPEPKPENFNGAVGKYTLTAQLDKEKIAVGDPLTLTLTVSGTGNIKSLPDLSIPPLTNFRTFDANAATNIEKKDGQVSGSKVYKTVLIPIASGELTIPSVPFVFFDTESRSYKTIKSRPLTVHVVPGATGSAGSAPNWGQTPAPTGGTNQAAPGIKLLGEDIRYIRTPGMIAQEGEPLYRRGWYRWLHIVLAGLLVLGGLVRLYFQLFLSNTALSRFRKARETAIAEIGKSDDYLVKNDIKGAGGHLSDVLQNYLAAKMGIENQSASLREIVDRLKSRGLLAHTGEKVRNIWETFDLYQFAPAQVQVSEVRASMETLRHVIDEVEKEITWKD
jgi:hypothetical protein